MNPRFKALELSSSRKRPPIADAIEKESSTLFGAHVFNRNVMQQMLPRDIYKNIINAIEGKEKIKPEHADSIALAMKEWAIGLGATHYSHWFQPLTGASAEKHDAFIDWNTPDQVLEKFNGKQLIQGEPDASSFPSGGLRSTYEARGYTGWDPTSPVFIWYGGDGATLCIPSVFFSWTGDVLDTKIPLLRSDNKIDDAAMRLLRMTGIEAAHVFTTLGCEQEYFVVDRAWRNLRPDLVLAGRTVFGASPSKGQELQDHYFGAVKDRVLYFMRDFEMEALKLGIPVKTRHNEVAPAQHEVAPVFERSSIAIDHNILLMELMRQTAVKHDLSCLLHEKPFHGINGSGKHCNWSLSTDTGINLLDPTESPGNNVHFLVLLTAILHAVRKHSALLRASIGSSANDFRLGGHEAPPAIISVYLGKEIETILDNIVEKGAHPEASRKIAYDLGLKVGSDLTRDHTDRNRTSPFAFTGNKFEFRAVGSSANPAFPVTVLNAIVADSLNEILDDIERSMEGKGRVKTLPLDYVVPVLKKYILRSRGVLFDGDNYSEAWAKEAKRRGLPVITKSIAAFEALLDEETFHAFKGILTKEELHSRYDILAETYSHTVNIETRLMVEIYRTQVLPTAIRQQKEMADSIQSCKAVIGAKELTAQKKVLKHLVELIGESVALAEDLEKERGRAESLQDLKARGKAFCEKVTVKGDKLREVVDKLEMLIDDTLWPLPKYREILFLI